MSVKVYRRSPLYTLHRGLGARMMRFAGWELPARYGSIVLEHQAVRQRAGLFDVSHMGEIVLEGDGALDTLERLTINEVSRLGKGEEQYTALITEEGTCIDDLIVLRQGEKEYLLVVNASNKDADFTWIDLNKSPGTVIRDISDNTALLALQGPCAEAIVADCCGVVAKELRSFTARAATIEGTPVLLSRTGYTGEDGFEIMVSAHEASKVWTVIMEAGKPYGLLPCGLGARDSLRLEAALPLYGNELDRNHTVLEANLGRFVKFDKPVEFIGKEALLRQKEQGLARRLIGFVLEGRSIARHGFAIESPGGEVIGEVTSGGYSPTLNKSIGMGYVKTQYAEPGTELVIKIRSKPVPGKVVRLPFYRRPKKERSDE